MCESSQIPSIFESVSEKNKERKITNWDVRDEDQDSFYSAKKYQIPSGKVEPACVCLTSLLRK